MRICVVAPRYGPEIVGGAEKLLRDYAVQLQQRGHQITVFTSRAKSLFTWDNAYPGGEQTVEGIRVHRFDVTYARDDEVMARLQFAIDSNGGLDEEFQDEWIRNTGYSQPMMDAIKAAAGQVDLFLFAPYLLASTVYGARIHPHKSVIVPCLHDEPYARFAPVQATLRGAAGLLFNTVAEQRLAERLIANLPPHWVVGGGLDAVADVAPRNFKNAPAAAEDYLVYAGRRDEAKNFPLLLDWLELYNRESAPLQLVAMGTGAFPPQRGRAFVRDCGFVSTGEKANAMAGALATVNLSTNESFSYVLFESWSCRRPVIVHADCPVTVEHCKASNGGLWVRDAAEFQEAIDYLRRSPEMAQRLGVNGCEYLNRDYRWTSVASRLENALQVIGTNAGSKVAAS